MTAIDRILASRVALVTGTSPNIGTGIALALACAGATVVCADRDKALAELAAKEIRETGGQALASACDVREEEDVERVVHSAENSVGPIDILINGAVVYNAKGVRDMPLDEWRVQLAVLLDGAFLCTKYVVRRLIALGRPGAIINLISTAGHQGEPNNIGYATAKAGLLNFTRSAAVELAAFGIRVNSLTPTATDPTEAIERARRWGLSEPPVEVGGELDRAALRVPMGRLPKPSDYGAAAVFLASEAAAMITGIDLPVDAGSLANYWRNVPPPQTRNEGSI